MIENHLPRCVGPEVQARINALKIGQKMQDLPEHLWHKSFHFYVKEDPTRRGGPNLRLIRLDPTKPSLTVTAYIFNKFVHPHEDRFITPREAARLQGFPDDFTFVGGLTSTQLQVGNAVPVDLARAVFNSVLESASNEVKRRKIFPAISLFSGAGGMDIGAEQAKAPNGAIWRTMGFIEIDKDCCDGLRNYFGAKPKVLQADIRTLNPSDVLRDCRISKEDLFLVYGGPPCQAFSQAGKQRGLSDPRGTLVSDFLRFIKNLRPRYFVMENVQGLRGVSQGKLLDSILEQMGDLGYTVNFGLLTAASYGAPQLRQRLFFIGTRKGLKPASLPSPTHAPEATLFLKPYRIVGEAFEGLPKIGRVNRLPKEGQTNGHGNFSAALRNNEPCPVVR